MIGVILGGVGVGGGDDDAAVVVILGIVFKTMVMFSVHCR